MTGLSHFLIVFDLKRRELLLSRDLGEDGQRAAVVYSEYEARFRDDPGKEIVLIGADSLDTIRHTHAQYFGIARPEPLLDLFGDE